MLQFVGPERLSQKEDAIQKHKDLSGKVNRIEFSGGLGADWDGNRSDYAGDGRKYWNGEHLSMLQKNSTVEFTLKSVKVILEKSLSNMGCEA